MASAVPSPGSRSGPTNLEIPVEPRFWHERWESGQLGFHQADVNDLLKQHWSALEVDPSAPVFVPLCGKSLDMRWLRERGHPVIGVEISPIAIREFFEEAGIESHSDTTDGFERFSGGGFTLYCGDFFDLTKAPFAEVRAVYDRASLIALPESGRSRYVRHLTGILPETVSILLITIEYDPGQMEGPPYSVSPQEVDQLFGESFEIETLWESGIVPASPRFQERGLSTWQERVQRLVRRGGESGTPDSR